MRRKEVIIPNMNRKKLLLKLIIDLAGTVLIVWSLHRYLTCYDSLPSWQKTLLLSLVVIAIPAMFFVSFTDRIVKKYAFDERVLTGEDAEEDENGDTTDKEEPAEKSEEESGASISN